MSAIREQIRNLIAANVPHAEANLESYFDRNIEDLRAGGVDYRKAVNAAILVGCAHLIQDRGTAAAVNKLRDLADLFEQSLLDNSSRAQNAH